MKLLAKLTQFKLLAVIIQKNNYSPIKLYSLLMCLLNTIKIGTSLPSKKVFILRISLFKIRLSIHVKVTSVGLNIKDALVRECALVALNTTSEPVT